MFSIAVLAVACWLSSAAALAEENTPPDWQAVWSTLSNADPNKVQAAYAALAEATCFFSLVCSANILPMTPAGDLGPLTVAAFPPSFTAEYPLVIKAEIELKDVSKTHQWYFLGKESQGSDWRITEAWSVTTEGEKIKPLPVPSSQEQNRANSALPGLMKECGATKWAAWMKSFLSSLLKNQRK
jgi:hypothetical protein